MKIRNIHRLSLITLLLASFVISPEIAVSDDKEVIVYSARKEHLIKPLFDAYTQKTGVKIKYTTGKEGALLERLKAEGKKTPADMLITVDAGNLWQATQEGVLQPVESEILMQAIPENLRDPQNNWFGLSVRARTIVYNTDNVNPADLKSYEDLSSDTWKSKLILRTSKKVYNQSLVASLIAGHGEEKAAEIVSGWVNNLAAEPFSNDTKALEAVAVGLGDVTVVNTYYFGRLMNEKPQLPLAVFWPNQESDGVHMNVSGAGIVAHADNREGAQKLLEWLAGEDAQQTFAALNMEFPANPAVQPDPTVAAWGSFNGSPLNVALYGKLQAQAIILMDKAGYK